MSREWNSNDSRAIFSLGAFFCIHDKKERSIRLFAMRDALIVFIYVARLRAFYFSSRTSALERHVLLHYRFLAFLFHLKFQYLPARGKRRSETFPLSLARMNSFRVAFFSKELKSTRSEWKAIRSRKVWSKHLWVSSFAGAESLLSLAARRFRSN